MAEGNGNGDVVHVNLRRLHLILGIAGFVLVPAVSGLAIWVDGIATTARDTSQKLERLADKIDYRFEAEKVERDHLKADFVDKTKELTEKVNPLSDRLMKFLAVEEAKNSRHGGGG